ncbi:MAG: NADH-quinone oxidoreductase subunit C [Anaerolineae bacterium]|nr:NADH-quinone oxidoreductase subunit C [Anaerolineae bacterium]
MVNPNLPSAQLAALSLEESQPAPHRLDLRLLPENLLAAVQALVTARWGYLSAIIGLDDGEATLEVLYVFCDGPEVLTLRLPTPRNNAQVPTLTSIIPSAVLFERELREMFGVQVQGLAAQGPLFLADDWPPEVFPLLKDAALPGRLEGTA